ncbi:POT family-domain-containing protein [Bombardia bombarda]|uniref:POT family-domain-containing protein n=1 Tax=Bombardia bombarda TaxID=252184 RepID=A0AA39XLF2_9PEZI|nr:POT family-domain-containing protein [Bombardia bombarda]
MLHAAAKDANEKHEIAAPPAPAYKVKSLDGSSHNPDGTPTEEELRTLRRVPDKIPMSIYTIAFVELCERFSYYGTTAVFTNFIQHPLPPGSTTGNQNGSDQAGALGLGQRASTGLTTFNSFWQYTTPLLGAYKTGERVIVDPAVTASRVYHFFYLFINIGALVGQIGMVYCEAYIGFWLSFLLPTIMLSLAPGVMLWGRKRYRRVPPQGSVLGRAFKLFALANKGRWSINPAKTYRNLHDGTFWENVKPSRFEAESKPKPKWMDFNDAWVDEVARGFSACAVFLWYPLFWLCYNQINNNLISQAATLRLGGVPNDVLTNLNPFALIIMIPLLETFIYPAMRKMRFNFTPIKRITFGYFIAASAMVWAAVLQHYIYKQSECGSYPSSCPTTVDISVWAQTGSYVLIAFSEIMASITSLEYAHSKAPANLRSVVQSVALFMNAISSALGFALVYLADDPYLVWNYTTVAILAVIGGCGFWLQFRHLDKEEDHLNMLPKGKFGSAAEVTGESSSEHGGGSGLLVENKS